MRLELDDDYVIPSFSTINWTMWMLQERLPFPSSLEFFCREVAVHPHRLSQDTADDGALEMATDGPFLVGGDI